MAEATGLWIFGYGSLCWNPGFEFKRSMTGYVKGFGRRFWQGNDSHRGTSDKPGRVATLIDDRNEVTYGRAFEVSGSAALPYLEKRECTLGGYLTTISKFHPRDGSPSFPVVIYIATKANKHWLGEAPIPVIAQQILECEGPSGHNAEYLLRLADFMHRFIPEVHDEHLFTIEIIVRAKIKELNMCLKTLMGHEKPRWRSLGPTTRRIISTPRHGKHITLSHVLAILAFGSEGNLARGGRLSVF